MNGPLSYMRTKQHCRQQTTEQAHGLCQGTFCPNPSRVFYRCTSQRSPGHSRDDEVDGFGIERIIRHEYSHGAHAILRPHILGLFPKLFQFLFTKPSITETAWHVV